MGIPSPQTSRAFFAECDVLSLHLRLVDATRDEFDIQFADVFDQIVAYGQGAPINVVNPDPLRQSHRPKR